MKDIFRQWITDGWQYRYQYNEHMRNDLATYKARVQYEASIIERQGFIDYFLIVADLVTWAKGQGIAVGPGRGSSAGSLICYLLRITEIDPMQFPMLFERFLDPTRTDPPDIDIDFDDSRRDEVFDYAKKKYGEDHVANIGTFTRYKGRNSLDDVGRVYHIPAWKIDTIKSKLLDRSEGDVRFSQTLVDTYNTFDDIRALVEQTTELRYAARLEGNIRNFGVHAAGLVISSVPITQICATYERRVGERQGSAIAFDKYDAAYLGLLKIDCLGLTTLGVIAKACELSGISLEDLYRVPLDDEKVMDAFRAGDTLGIFQFEGITTRRILKAIKPTRFMELSDINALSRPGADDKGYRAAKERQEAKIPDLTQYRIHPIIKKHLSWTHGVVVYEEQILMILRDLGGFAPTELNRMRKIIHDKLGSTAFNEYRERFVNGASKQELSEKLAGDVWDGMVGASGYAFCIAHSVSYSHIGYWTQWLKVHYPIEFFAANLFKCGDNTRRAKFIQEAYRHGIKVVPPNLLESQDNWVLDRANNRIIAGFDVIDGIGPKTTQAIINWRDFEIKCNARKVDWNDLDDIKGIGPKTIEKIKEFIESDDPFDAFKVQRILESVRKCNIPGVPIPTHASVDIPIDRQLVTFCGIVRKIKYYDAAEQLTKRTMGLSYEQALQKLEDKHLLKYVALYCEDEYDEQVVVRINRWEYPRLAGAVSSIKVDSDVVVAQGKSSDFQGISIQCKRLAVLEV